MPEPDPILQIDLNLTTVQSRVEQTLPKQEEAIDKLDALADRLEAIYQSLYENLAIIANNDQLEYQREQVQILPAIEAVKTVADSILQDLTDFKEAMADLLDVPEAIEIVTDLVEDLGSATSPVIQGIGDFLSSTFSGLPSLPDLLGSLAGQITDFVPVLGQVLDELQEQQDSAKLDQIIDTQSDHTDSFNKLETGLLTNEEINTQGFYQENQFDKLFVTFEQENRSASVPKQFKDAFQSLYLWQWTIAKDALDRDMITHQMTNYIPIYTQWEDWQTYQGAGKDFTFPTNKQVWGVQIKVINPPESLSRRYYPEDNRAYFIGYAYIRSGDGTHPERELKYLTTNLYTTTGYPLQGVGFVAEIPLSWEIRILACDPYEFPQVETED